MIEMHKRQIELWKSKLGISDYGIAWIAFFKGLIIGLLIFYLGAYLSQPNNYEDCLLRVADVAETDRGVSAGRVACSRKFLPPSKPIDKDRIRELIEQQQEINEKKKQGEKRPKPRPDQ